MHFVCTDGHNMHVETNCRWITSDVIVNLHFKPIANQNEEVTEQSRATRTFSLAYFADIRF